MISITYTQELFVQAARLNLWRNLHRRLYWAGPLVLCLLVLEMYLYGWTTGAILSCVLWPVAFFVLMVASSWLGASRAIHRMPLWHTKIGQTETLHWDEQYLCITAGENHRKIAWPLLTRMDENRAVVLLYLSVADIVVIPRNLLADADLAFLRAHVAQPSQAVSAEMPPQPQDKPMIVLRYTPQMLAEAARLNLYQWLKISGWRVALLFVVLGNSLFYLSDRWSGRNSLHVLIDYFGLGWSVLGMVLTPVLILAMFFCIAWCCLPLLERRRFQRQPSWQQPVQVSWDAQHLYRQSASAESCLPWGDFSDVRESRTLILLYRHNAAYYLYPKASFGSEALLADFRAHLPGKPNAK